MRAGAVVRDALDETNFTFLASGDHTEVDVVEVFGDDPIGGGARQRGLLRVGRIGVRRRRVGLQRYERVGRRVEVATVIGLRPSFARTQWTSMI